MPGAQDILLTGAGAVTSVGWDAVTTGASIRAGLTRPAPVFGAVMVEPDTHQEVPVTGHPAGSVTTGFAAPARWLRMAELAFADLMQAAALPSPDNADFWSSTGLVFVTPPLTAPRFEGNEQVQPETIDQWFVVPLCRRMGFATPTLRTHLLAEGHAGVIQVLAGYDALTERLRVSRLVVLVVDSFLDGVSLHYLAAHQRLKTFDSAAGLVPGESAVALLVERATSAVQGRRSSVRVAACGYDALSSGENGLSARSLFGVMTACLASQDAQDPFEGALYANLNGERARAQQFGEALARIPGATLGAFRLETPATSVGDVGAAASGLGLVLAWRALQWGYSPANTVLVVGCASEESGPAACMLQRIN